MAVESSNHPPPRKAYRLSDATNRNGVIPLQRLEAGERLSIRYHNSSGVIAVAVHCPKKSEIEQRTALVIAAFGILLSCAVLQGCVAPARLPARAQGPSGDRIEKKDIDLAFLQVGATHRQDALAHLAAVNTGYVSPRMFWGRWIESKWGYWWIVIAPASEGAGDGDVKRKWHARNLLLTFDGAGLLSSKVLIEDERSFWPELHRQLADAPPLDLSKPMPIELSNNETGPLLLTKEGIEVDRTRNRFHGALDLAPAHYESQSKELAHISPSMVVRISHDGALGIKEHASSTCHTLHLSQKTVLGRRLHVCADAPNLVALLQYLQQTGSSELRWE
ncbi:MAG TPA: hypothetical protein VMI10_01680 [Terriglobales bacterium]|nr:hypothetical protein [Terriglobales bacterium]